jgi:L-ascorbate metabolism protein UlaG (beta-lactamase superfamily)
MIVEQIWTGNAYRNFNYLIACSETGDALAIDPLDYEKCLRVAKDHGWTITQVLNTHEHGDHLDPRALEKVRTAETKVVLTKACARQVYGGIVMQNGDLQTVDGMPIEAFPAYNVVHKRDSGEPFHPRGAGNGYVIAFGDKRVYVAGDTENIPEMQSLTNIEVAFLPMNLPFTMTPEMVAEAAKAIRPEILYPYHYGDTDTSKLVDILKDQADIEVRIRRMA